LSAVERVGVDRADVVNPRSGSERSIMISPILDAPRRGIATSDARMVP
jgi:hypothetical protein